MWSSVLCWVVLEGIYIDLDWKALFVWLILSSRSILALNMHSSIHNEGPLLESTNFITSFCIILFIFVISICVILTPFCTPPISTTPFFTRSLLYKPPFHHTPWGHDPLSTWHDMWHLTPKAWQFEHIIWFKQIYFKEILIIKNFKWFKTCKLNISLNLWIELVRRTDRRT